MTGKSFQKEIAKGKLKVKVKFLTQILTCSKSTMEILEKGVKNVQK